MEHGSDGYWATVELRRQVLRAPIGLDFRDDELDAEADDIHFAVLDGGIAKACAVLTPSGVDAKMRQVAVVPALHGQGLGRMVVGAFETEAKRLGFGAVVLNARDTAVEFYLKLGYEVVGEEFTEVGIPHRRMRKELPPSS